MLFFACLVVRFHYYFRWGVFSRCQKVAFWPPTRRKLACVSVYLWATHSAATVTSCCCCRVEYAIIEELLIWLKCEPSQSTPEQQQQRRIKMKQVQEGIFFNDPNLYELIYGQNRCCCCGFGGSGSPAFDQLKRGGDIHLPIDTRRYSTMAWIFHAESYDLMDDCRANEIFEKPHFNCF